MSTNPPIKFPLKLVQLTTEWGEDLAELHLYAVSAGWLDTLIEERDYYRNALEQIRAETPAPQTIGAARIESTSKLS